MSATLDAKAIAVPVRSPPSWRKIWKSRGGLMVVGAIVFALAMLLAFLDYRSTDRPEDRALVLTLSNSDYAAPFETPAVGFSAAQLENRIRLSAPLDNSWMDVVVAVIDHEGKVAASFDLYLVYYYESNAGRWWQTGTRHETFPLTLPAAGEYRFRVAVTQFTGASKVRDPLPVSKPVHFEVMRGRKTGVNLRVLGFMALSFSGIALVLYGAAGPRLDARGPAAHRQVAAARENGRPAAGERMVFLDGLRGIAAVGVLVCHLFVPELSAPADHLVTALAPAVSEIALHSYLGVEIFFVLSGFVIAYSLRRYRIGLSMAARFVLRRSLRLDPPYHVALLLGSGVAALGYPDSVRDVVLWLEGLPGILANMFYVQDIAGYPSTMSVAWTLCLEIQFYLAYFALLWIAQRLAGLRPAAEGSARRKVEALWVLVLAGSLAVWSVHRWFPEARDFGFGGTWFRFFLGVLTFWATQEKLLRAALIGAAIMIGIASATLSDQRGAMAAAAALLILFASANGRSTRWLAGQGWQHLGRISYSLYLSHVAVGLPLMNWIWRGLPHSPAWAGAMCVVGIAVSLAGAEALHRLVESPALRLSQRIRYAPTGGIAPEPVRRGVIHGSVEGGMVPAEPGG